MERGLQSGPDTKDQKNSLGQQQPDLANKKILLVEDQEFNQLLIQKIMSHWNVCLHIAGNGKEAIQILNNHDIDLVIMDIQLPGMSGLEVTRFIRDRFEHPKNAVPIIALTAYAIEGDAERYLAAGMNDCLFKPFKSNELYNIICTYLNRKESNYFTTCKEEKTKSTPEKYELTKLIEIAKGDHSFIVEMILVFLEQCNEINDALKDARSKNNIPLIGKLAHKLKGSAEIMGLHTIKDELKKIVALSGTDNNHVNILTMTDFVLKELNHIIPQLISELNNWKS